MKWGRVGAIAMVVLLALYLALTFRYSWALVTAPEPLAKAMGVALVVLPAVGVWYLVSELRFVFRGERLLARLDAEGGLPVDDLPRRPSGRIDPAAGRERLAAAPSEAVAATDWRAAVRRSLAYDAAGDRPKARAEMRAAIRLSRAEPSA